MSHIDARATAAVTGGSDRSGAAAASINPLAPASTNSSGGGIIYLDYNATSPVDGRVARAVYEVVAGELDGPFANPSSAHRLADAPRALLARARQQVADLLDAGSPDEVLFESCGTESINHVFKALALQHWRDMRGLTRDCAAASIPSDSAPGAGSGAATFSGNSAASVTAGAAATSQRPHIVTSAIEHVAVLESCAWLQAHGFADVTYVPVGRDGVVAPADVAAAYILGRTVLVSVMLANNETGAVQPLRAIVDAVTAAAAAAEAGRVAVQTTGAAGAAATEPATAAVASVHPPTTTAAPPPRRLPLFHTDASQAFGKLPFSVRRLGVDLLTIAGHKLYCPKGIGATWVRQDVKLPSLMHGAGQEGGRRAGTENLVLAVALGAAAAIFSAPAAADSGAAGRLDAEPPDVPAAGIAAAAGSEAPAGQAVVTQQAVEVAHAVEMRDRLAARLLHLWRSEVLSAGENVTAATHAGGATATRPGVTSAAAASKLPLAPMPVIHGPLAAELAHLLADGSPSSGVTAAQCMPVGGASAGTPTTRPLSSLPNTLYISFPGAFAAKVVALLADTVAISAGAACHSSSPGDPRTASVSHVLRAMGVSTALALTTLRLSVGRWTTAADVDEAAARIIAAVKAARAHRTNAVLRSMAQEEDAAAAATAAAIAGRGADHPTARDWAAVSHASETTASTRATGAGISGGELRLRSPVLPATDPLYLLDTHRTACCTAAVAWLPLQANAKGEGAPCLRVPAAPNALVGPSVPLPGVAATPDAAAAAAEFGALALRATVAHPQGGGQPADRGVILFPGVALRRAAARSPVRGGVEGASEGVEAGAGAAECLGFVFHAVRKATAPAAAAAGSEEPSPPQPVVPDAGEVVLHYGRFAAFRAPLAERGAADACAYAAHLASAVGDGGSMNADGGGAGTAAAFVRHVAAAQALAALQAGSAHAHLGTKRDGGGSTLGLSESESASAAAVTELGTRLVILHDAPCCVAINGPHRQLSARLHSAGHLLDLAVRRVIAQAMQAQAAAAAGGVPAAATAAATAAETAAATAAETAAVAAAPAGTAAPAAAAGAGSEEATPVAKGRKGAAKGAAAPQPGASKASTAAAEPPLEQLVPGKGYHFADGPYVEYSGAIPSRLLEGFPAAVEAACAELLAADAATRVAVVRSDDVASLAAAGLSPQDVGHLPAGAPVRIVCVGGADNSCPCGGTHVTRAGEIGSAVRVGKVTSKKGKVRVPYTLEP